MLDNTQYFFIILAYGFTFFILILLTGGYITYYNAILRRFKKFYDS